MEIKNRNQLLEFIRKESLRLIKETEAFADLEDKVADIEEVYIETFEKKYEKLKAEEEKAMAEENYVELQKIKEEKAVALKKLIDAYKVKTRYLEQIHVGLQHELGELGNKGSGVFKDKLMTEFNNEDLQKNNVIKITTLSSEIKLQKINDNNQYSVLSTNASGIQAGDILALPDMIVGKSAQVTVYRKGANNKYDNIGTPKLEVIKAITKNPS